MRPLLVLVALPVPSASSLTVLVAARVRLFATRLLLVLLLVLVRALLVLVALLVVGVAVRVRYRGLVLLLLLFLLLVLLVFTLVLVPTARRRGRRSRRRLARRHGDSRRGERKWTPCHVARHFRSITRVTSPRRHAWAGPILVSTRCAYLPVVLSGGAAAREAATSRRPRACRRARHVAWLHRLPSENRAMRLDPSAGVP